MYTNIINNKRNVNEFSENFYNSNYYGNLFICLMVDFTYF
ncbi:hypothetical protein RV18_GL000281 [Enterococcus termitis]|nr:hypothetical protein RV18_GL000281 [Enterococcus termitis]